MHKCKTLSKIYLKQKRAGVVAQVVDCLPSKCEFLSSNPKRNQESKEVPISNKQ
jgi:hypothetical protein